jgi:DNA-directed RNA polymerase specialized sigma24 family protein
MQSFESDKSTASPEDADLQEDFDDIYRTTAPMVYAFCLRILRDADDAVHRAGGCWCGKPQ